MNTKVVAMRALRVLLILLALGFCGYSVASQWDATTRAFQEMSWPTLAGALLVGLAGLFSWTLGWRTFLAGLGSPLPLRVAYRISAVSQLGKYVPGKVWALVTQIEMTREHKVPAERSFGSTLLAVATSTACGLAVAAVTLPLTSAAARREYWWLFLLAPFMIAALHPRIVTWALGMLLRLVRRPPLEHPVSLGVTLRAVGWTVLGWALFGVHTWLLCMAVGGDGPGLPFLATGAYALAFVAGFLVFIAPGGIGAREAALTVVLTPVLPAGAPVVVAIASRVLLTIADLVNAGAGMLLGRGAGRPGPPSGGAGDGGGNEGGRPALVRGTQPTKE
ncbi:lysylphosphatidylglycerol synthase transmembrane domain-containing protein [Actinomadura opuntiae]|uniref:lysylphosphatidylglycerol synthase transmembrane domain-containing protein n=1 Tax=Actinomadura sp. OS1-43 TaxID=604315 RepID=UPI00255B12FE|nr:lysylphosphatidylglycerol synthase transmembrane domain-containing protein [Actinomadura sp. OS1-43]MDL4814675.1 lysylphosphatidylglycerol synthase transmembrane domain-containing protein [Actinomadura sp. OS1-43]